MAQARGIEVTHALGKRNPRSYYDTTHCYCHSGGQYSGKFGDRGSSPWGRLSFGYSHNNSGVAYPSFNEHVFDSDLRNWRGACINSNTWHDAYRHIYTTIDIYKSTSMDG